MKEKFKRQFPVFGWMLVLALVFSGFSSINLQAQERISGVVKDASGLPLPGVSVIQKGTTRGASTDFDGKYSVELTTGEKTLVFSYIGFKEVEIPVNGQTTINLTMEEDLESLDEVVVVGYGTQKKESVVGSISQISGEDLQELNMGITNVEEALQGNLPGVTAIQGSGVPGRNDMQIFIRGQASWNGSGQPLILVDGVPRPIDNVDFNDIENLSVLKDASATAVFGVQGANGVILITTKRGKKGKAQLSLQANTTFKFVSKLPEKLDAYDAILQANSSIMRELSQNEDSWNLIRPLAIAERFRNPANEEERLIYPNVNWRDVLLKDMAQDYRINLSVRGGGNNAKYFGSLAYQTVADVFDGASYDNGKGYESEFSYDRFNFRSNIDFNITKTTEFSVNLGGFLGIQQTPGNLNLVTNAIYELAPNAYNPVFPDGFFGRDNNDVFANTNPIVTLTNTGYTTNTTFNINTDFILKQKLDFITKGLSFQGRFSLDNTSVSRQRLLDPGADGQENVRYRVFNEFFEERVESPDGVNDFGFVPFPWTLESANIQNGTIGRRLLYDFSLNYSKTFAEKHSVTGLALLRRNESGTGNGFLRYREDWVGRITYDYDKRYFLDISGAYNGSEKYGPGFRFDLFPALAAGWTVSNESFMSDVDWVNNLKIRGSYGLIGDDSGGNRFEYLATWNIGGGAFINPNASNVREGYVFYSEDNVGNPNLQWETALKYNIGADIGLFNNSITAELDFWGEDRSNILIPSTQRAVPDWFGANPPAFNRGEVEVRGYDIVIGANHTFANDLNIFGNFIFTRAKDVVLDREDPELRPFYQKAAGYPIGQPRSAIPSNIIASLDDLYSSTPRVNGQGNIRPGYYNLVDYDGDGTYNGANHIKSPNLDKLASQSLIFNKAYCNIPVCGASRASLMTGARPTRKRFINAHIKKDEDYPEAISLPMLLRKNGYKTISNGKIYHYKNDDSKAWDEIWQADRLWSYALTESQDIRKNTKRGLPFEAAEVHDSVYRDGKLALKVIQDLNKLKQSNQPFFLTMGLAKPHLPFTAPRKYWDLYNRNEIELPESYLQPKTTPKQAFHNYGELRNYENIPKKGDIPEDLAKELIHGYYACVSYIDAQIGLVLEELKRLELEDDTIVILWGDHGWNLGDHKLWCKHVTFETALKTPLIIKVPGQTKGQKTDAITEYIDIYPSLAELVGLEVPSTVDGKSFVPILNGEKSEKDWAVSKFKDAITLIKGDLFYTEWTDDKGIAYARMLFDHKTDPLELDNLAEKPEYQDKVKNLSMELREKWGEDFLK